MATERSDDNRLDRHTLELGWALNYCHFTIDLYVR